MTEQQKTLSRSEQKRRDILMAAVSLFSTEGFQNSSMDMIATEAKVSKRTVYNHFPSKEALFKRILSDLILRIQQATDIPYQSNLSLKSQLQMVALNEIELFKDQGMIKLSRVCISESIHSPELVAEEMEKLNISNFGFGLWVQAAIADGKLVDEEPELLVNHFIGALKAVFFWPQLFSGEAMPNDKRSAQIVERSINMFLSEYQLKD